MKILVALAAMMTFAAPSVATPHVPGPDNEPAVDAFDCWIELQEVEQKGDPCRPSTSDIEFVLVFEIDELTGEVFGPIDILFIANTAYGEAVLDQVERELSIDPVFDLWSWNRLAEDRIDEAFLLDLQFQDYVFNDEPLETQSLDETAHYLTSPQDGFMMTICEGTSRPTSPPPEKKPCHQKEPAITNDEALRLMEGLAEKIRPETSIRPTPKKKTRRGGHSTFIQNQGRRHGMTPGA
jgi:hypothetical protein